MQADSGKYSGVPLDVFNYGIPSPDLGGGSGFGCGSLSLGGGIGSTRYTFFGSGRTGGGIVIPTRASSRSMISSVSGWVATADFLAFLTPSGHGPAGTRSAARTVIVLREPPVSAHTSPDFGSR